MTPRERAVTLVRLVESVGWTIEFVASGDGHVVHVVGPDHDQPAYLDWADQMLTRRYRVVCGVEVRFDPWGGLATPFDDERLCQRCHGAFDGHGAQALVFAHNTEAAQRGSNNDSIRRNHDAA